MKQGDVIVQNDRRASGQFRLACHSCRERQIPCDQAKPTCLNCIRRGLPCYGGVTVKKPQRKVAFPRIAPPTRMLAKQGPYNNAHEGRAFQFVTADLAPLLGSFIDEVFWTETIMPAACKDKRLFYAVLAYSSRFHNETWLREPDHDKQAISWYNKSVSEAINKYNTSTDILLNIKMCGFYCFLENKYGDSEAGFKLRLTAYKIAYSMQDKLDFNEDAISTLCWISDNAITGATGSSRVPYVHFKAINDLGLKMSRTSRHEAKYNLYFRLWQIMYDVDTLLLNQEPPEDLDSRVGLYEASLVVFDVNPKNIFLFLRMRFLFGLARVQHETLKGEATEILRNMIKNLHLGSSIQNCRKLVLDTYVGPGLAFLRWHYKFDDLDDDIADILATFDQPDLKDSLNSWLLMLHFIMDGDRSALAMEVLGQSPRILRLQDWLTMIRLVIGIRNIKCVYAFLEKHPQKSSKLAKMLKERREKASKTNSIKRDL